jgi:hypothetical protein
MSDPEGFLSRWSRRKQQAVDPEPATQSAPERPDPAPPDEKLEGDKQDTGGPKAVAPKSAQAEASEAAFDLSKLPPIESITAATDIRGFLAPGVPLELTRAALRRAWVVDPTIRDYIGLSENAWDFTAPDGVPGFDLARPSERDLKNLLANVFGADKPEQPKPESDTTSAGSGGDQQPLPAQQSEIQPIVNAQTEADGPKQPRPAIDQNAEHEQDHAALQQAQLSEQRPTKRGRGGALPR